MRSALDKTVLGRKHETAGLKGVIASLDIRLIRRDGDTQGRVRMNRAVVKEYADCMRADLIFPAVRVWFDGATYWLSDGFQRVFAAELVGQSRITAEVFLGTLDDAKWDSYGANSAHGCRRTRVDVNAIVERAVAHTKGVHLSKTQIARHLGVAEATIRRWRIRNPHPPSGEHNAVRLASRNGAVYLMDTKRIGKGQKSNGSVRRTLDQLHAEFNNIKVIATPRAREVLGILAGWVFDGGPSTVCLDRIEALLVDVAVCGPKAALLSSSVRR